MIEIDLIKFKSKLPAKAKIMALDLGRKKIGIATTDEGRIFAIPKTIITRKSNIIDFNKIISIMQENNIFALICGLPLMPNGSCGEMADFALCFASKFYDHYVKITTLDIDILMFDERLSSFSARTFIVNKSKAYDDIAASLILQDFLTM
jgi:putative Holliday junction resolvase